MSGTGISVQTVARPDDRARAFDIRRRVFQGEQGVPAEEEFDADDDAAVHVLAEIDGRAVGTARIVFHPGYAKIGRMAVLKDWRRLGIGRALMEALTRIAAGYAQPHLVLHAQVQAIPFYETMGFRVVSDEFEEAGIMHRKMERNLAS